MGDFEIGKMLAELWTKRRVIVCLNFLDGEGEMLADFLKEDIAVLVLLCGHRCVERESAWLRQSLSIDRGVGEPFPIGERTSRRASTDRPGTGAERPPV